jgi:predicted 2-oxoglutarate/Fe(II)-dependent dioxygenase YbiX
MLRTGDFIPHFTARASGNPAFNFHASAGRVVVLAFIAPDVATRQAQALEAMAQLPAFKKHGASLFFVTLDPGDEMPGVLPLRIPDIYALYDADGAVRTLFDVPPGPAVHVFVASHRMQIAEVLSGDNIDVLTGALEASVQNALAGVAPGVFHPPVLVIPDIFEPELRRTLIDGYKRHGGAPSGFMRDVDGRTTYVEDPRHKIRRDWLIEDADLLATIQDRFNRRVAPEIYKAFQFEVTRTERFIVACYTASDGGHFRAHRDNTTIGTAHRRFAMSVNLNAEEYEGGDLRFPEFGPAIYRAPSGGGIVFSCSLLHEATRVTKGERYAFLPFFYDEAGEQIRLRNLPFTDAGAQY